GRGLRAGRHREGGPHGPRRADEGLHRRRALVVHPPGRPARPHRPPAGLSHPLAALLDAAARGRFPRPDGTLAVLPAPPGASMAVVGFTAHPVVAAAGAPHWVP